MAHMYGRTEFVSTAHGVRVSGFAMHSKMISIAAETLRSGEVKLLAGVSTICIPNGSDEDDLEAILTVKQNLPMDVLFFSSFPADIREGVFTIRRNVAVPDAMEGVETLELRNAQIAIVFSTYILHGSLGNFAKNPTKPAAFGITATGAKPEDLTSEALCSFPDFTKAKFPAIAEMIPELMAVFHSTLQSRSMLSTGGNRFFSILKRMGDKLDGVNGVPPQIRLMASQIVLDNAPYASFHPDHPSNPMGSCAKAMLAAIGHFGRIGGVTWTDEQVAAPGLYIPQILAGLQAPYLAREHKMPNMEALLNSIDASMSIPMAVAALAQN